MMFENSHFVSE